MQELPVNRITGMLGVCSTDKGNARLDYEIDTATNRVTYRLDVLRPGWTAERYPDGLEGTTRVTDYAEALALYNAACDSLNAKEG